MMRKYIELLRQQKAEGRYPLDAYEEAELAKADAVDAKRLSFKEGDMVYMPKLGDTPRKAGRYLFACGDHGMVDWNGYQFSYPLEYLDPLPNEGPVSTELTLLLVVAIPVLVICGFLYHLR